MAIGVARSAMAASEATDGEPSDGEPTDGEGSDEAGSDGDPGGASGQGSERVDRAAGEAAALDTPDEVVGMACDISLSAMVSSLRHPRPSTYFGLGRSADRAAPMANALAAWQDTRRC